MSNPFSHAKAIIFSPLQYRYMLVAAILLSGNLMFGKQAIAASPAPGVVIENQATGSYVDTSDNQSKTVSSDIVKLTVVEIAGITVTATGATGTPNPGRTVYFNYTIKNVGNDPTQFFIPALGTLTGNATQPSNIQITGYSIDGTTLTDLSTTPITVPNGGDQTGRNSTGTAGLLKTPNPNGEFQPNGYITVRIPVLINSTGVSTGDIVTAQLGDTPVDSASTATPKDRQQNIAYDNTNTVTNRVYTVDDADALNVTNESTGFPFNGDTTNHRQEASAIAQLSIVVLSVNISGNVFEDPNYGGGAGRPLSTSGISLVDGATVELYKSDGSYVSNTTTSGGGKYTFNSVTPGDYYVRVVNSTVKSVRPGTITGLLPVQTFRVNDSTGTPTDDTARVGGEKPSVADTGAAATGAILNTTNFTFAAGAGNAPAGAQAQSITSVKVGSSAVTGIDFGYNFDTIVNTNDSGQGSLRQFINNSNALHGEASLAQVNPANPNLISGKETSIFMIPDGAAHPGLSASIPTGINGTGGNTGSAVIKAISLLPAITDKDTTIDGSTQTANIGDKRSGVIGTGGKVGVDQLVLDTVPQPEIMIDGNAQDGSVFNLGVITVSADNVTLEGFGIYNAAGLNNGGAAILVGNQVTTASGAATIRRITTGTLADGSDPGASLRNGGHGVAADGVANISNVFAAYNGNYGFHFRGANYGAFKGDGSSLTNSESAYNDQLSGSGDSISIHSTNITLRGNLSRNANAAGGNKSYNGNGIELWFGSTGCVIENNTVKDNGSSGISVNQDSSNTLIDRNIITGSLNGPGILLGIESFGNAGNGLASEQVKITKNSIYANKGLGIELTPSSGLGNGVTPNNGAVLATLPNKGMDYPIITSSTLNSSTLTLKGFVGSNPAGSTTFAGATLEFFIADNADNDQNGEVIVGDLKSKPHGEGKTYIGSCTADANGLFGTVANPCTLSNAVTSAMAVTDSITSTATDTNGNTSEFSAPAISNPNVLLVKRITAINGNPTNGSVSLNAYDPDLSVGGYPYDKNVIVSGITPPTTDKWPGTSGASTSTFLLGARDGGVTKPNDEVEYTIYFLSAGSGPAQNVQLCDRLPVNQAFIPNSYNFLAPGPGVAPSVNADRGIALSYNGAYESYTNVNDTDIAQYYQPGQVPLPSFCATAANPNINSNPTGAVVINLGAGATNAIGGSLTNATAPGTPPTSYGFVRFKVKNVLP
jgi:trimeric autotransporter adhesin